MNFFPNGDMIPFNNGMFLPNDIFNKIMELENRIKILEQKIIKIEKEIDNDNYDEPDDSLYMI